MEHQRKIKIDDMKRNGCNDDREWARTVQNGIDYVVNTTQ